MKTSGPSDFESHVKAHLKRLANFPGYPETREQYRDYIAALSVLETQEQVTRELDYWIGFLLTGDRCPTAADIRRHAWETREHKLAEIRAAKMPAKAHCARCGDSGVVEITRAEDLHSIASWCACVIGRAHSWPNGVVRKSDEDWCERVNRGRAYLLGRFPKTDPVAKIRERLVSGERGGMDDYHGAF